MTIATADLYDERGDALDSLSLQLQDLGGVIAFDGPIRTVRCQAPDGTRTTHWSKRRSRRPAGEQCS